MNKTHSPRKLAHNRARSWLCKCGTINLATAEKCKMIGVEKKKYLAAIEKNKRESRELLPPSPIEKEESELLGISDYLMTIFPDRENK